MDFASLDLQFVCLCLLHNNVFACFYINVTFVSIYLSGADILCRAALKWCIVLKLALVLSPPAARSFDTWRNRKSFHLF